MLIEESDASSHPVKEVCQILPNLEWSLIQGDDTRWKWRSPCVRQSLVWRAFIEVKFVQSVARLTAGFG